jgi:CRISPR-associated endonuclease/helicase Cas3
MDRRERYRDAVAIFKRDAGHLLVSTQVCEMSLDLDADLLITEVAPVIAVVQRMGRCRRRTLKPGDPPGDVLLLDTPSPAPYTGESLRETDRFFADAAPDRVYSQEELGVRLCRLEPGDRQAAGGIVGFLDGGMYAMGADESFRETDEFTRDAVLDTDLEAFLRLRDARDGQAQGFVCPVPRGDAEADPRVPPGMGVARAERYSAELGFISEAHSWLK